jgi:hypothetical protein
MERVIQYARISPLKPGINYLQASSFSSTQPQWLVPPEVLQPAGLLYEPGFGSSHLYCQAPSHLQRPERPLAGKGELWVRNVR